MIKCFDIAQMVVNQATKDIGDGWVLAPGRMTWLEEICGGIDTFIANGCDEPDGIDVDVNMDTKEIVFGVEFDMCEFKISDSTYSVLRNANSILISRSKEDESLIRMEMRFDGVWITV